jgi:hypothetical protein
LLHLGGLAGALRGLCPAFLPRLPAITGVGRLLRSFTFLNEACHDF